MNRNQVGSVVHVRGGEPEEPKAAANEAILAPVVVNEPMTMFAIVVFDSQAGTAVKQIWPTQEAQPRHSFTSQVLGNVIA